MKTYFSFITIFFFIVIFSVLTNCKKKDLAVAPTVSSSIVKDITDNSAKSGGTVTADGGADVIARGVCWSSTNPNPTISDSKTSDGVGSGSFESSISGLNPATNYSVRAYATNSAGTGYGNQVSMTTLALLPTISTTLLTNILSTTAIGGGNISSDGGSPVTARGVCWSVKQNPTITFKDSVTVDGSGIGSFTSNISGLKPGLMYFVRSYSTNSVGTVYGNQVSFSTSLSLPTLTTNLLSNVTPLTVVSGGSITSDGGATVINRGVCWSITQNPTISGSKTINGSGTGSFSSTINNLDPFTIYYVRAYATNSIGTAYGNQIEIPKNTLKSLKIENPIDTIVISDKRKLTITATFSNGYSLDVSAIATITPSSDKITIQDNISIVGAKSGNCSVLVKYGDITTTNQFYVNYFEEVLSSESVYLRSNNFNAKINVPVIIINYHPTLDGINVDPRRFLDDYFIKDRYYSYYGLDRNVCATSQKNNPICKTGTLEMYKQRAQDLHSLTKFGIEEGSKFRGYSNSISKQSVNIEVIKYYNFYEIKTNFYNSKEVPQPDYQDIFKTINLENLVNNMGVKEVWFCLSPLSTEYPAITQGLISKEFLLNLPESNMSSPTGDISNSVGYEFDLPKYNKTYVVYGTNLDRGPSESIENRGHQIERELRYIEKNREPWPNELFWNKFVGYESTGNPFGRCGDTHFPPNTRIDYDWCNSTSVYSDIKNWVPSGGTKELVNNKTWLDIPYSFPSNIFWSKTDNVSVDCGYKWKIFWFQSIPNGTINIPYIKNGSQYIISDWWDIFYNWDDARTNGKTLWK